MARSLLGTRTRRFRFEWGLILFAFALRLAMVLVVRDSIYWGHQITQTDMYANYQWAMEICRGDWLGRNTYHPYFRWMREIAPIEDWYRWWGGRQIFQQSPLYPYLLALWLFLTNGSETAVMLFQASLGAAQCWLVFLLAKELFNERVAWIASLGAAAFGPFLLAESVMLRDFLSPLLLDVTLLGLLQAGKSQSRGWAVLSGGMFGLGLLARENVVFFLPFALLWLYWVIRGKNGTRAGVLFVGIWFGGCLFAVSPLIARNVAVGSPPLAFSNRTGEALVEGTSPFPYFPYDNITARIRQEMSQGPFSTVQFFRRYFEESGFTSVLYYGRKLLVMVDPFELWDNINYVYMQYHSGLARWSLGWRAVFPLGILGMIVASFRRKPGDYLMVGFFVSQVIAIIPGPVYSRYRLPLGPVLLIFGSYLLIWLRELVAVGGKYSANWKLRIPAVGLIMTTLIVYSYLLPFLPKQYHCMDEPFLIAAEFYLKQNRPAQALKELEALVKCAESCNSPMPLDQVRQTISQLKDSGLRPK